MKKYILRITENDIYLLNCALEHGKREEWCLWSENQHMKDDPSVRRSKAVAEKLARLHSKLSKQILKQCD